MGGGHGNGANDVSNEGAETPCHLNGRREVCSHIANGFDTFDELGDRGGCEHIGHAFVKAGHLVGDTLRFITGQQLLQEVYAGFVLAISHVGTISADEVSGLYLG